MLHTNYPTLPKSWEGWGTLTILYFPSSTWQSFAYPERLTGS
jgi:hypothetical protein